MFQNKLQAQSIAAQIHQSPFVSVRNTRAMLQNETDSDQYRILSFLQKETLLST